MKMLWCWRCQREIPMLEDKELALVNQARAEGMALVEAAAQRRGTTIVPMQLTGVASRLQPMLEMYKLLTGFEETNPNAVMHHAVHLYGPPCPQCHKPLRTSEARFCAACGFGQDDITATSIPLPLRQPDLFRK
ncbi:MAG: hypothetical protein M3Y12_05955 [Bacteroidota bacterium]|nr:hypothetical protein [Bacteroidota bacterium]